MKMFFAGSENNRVRRWLKECGVKRILMSYHYIMERGVNINNVLDDFEEIIIDSGGFTMYKFLYERGINFDYEDYYKNYYDFIEENAGKFFFVANYDVDQIVGIKRVLKWNEDFKYIEDKGQRVCYIAHDARPPYRNLEMYFEKYNYIGVSGGYYGKNDSGYLSRVYNLSLTKRKFVHGFGLTSFVLMTQFPFYSCDSTTYLGGARYGSTYVFNGAYFETWDYFQKHRRTTLKHWCEKWDIDYEGLINDSVEWVTKFNIKAWLENEKLFNARTRVRQWWNYPEYYKFDENGQK